MKVYLDIDGVLLGKWGDEVVLAKGAEALVEHLLERYECYWLTTHCRGDGEGPLSYLSQFANESLLEKLAQLHPTNFDVNKTEAIDLEEDFLWIDDSPLQGEIQVLEDSGLIHCWKRVNTYVAPNALIELLKELRS